MRINQEFEKDFLGDMEYGKSKGCKESRKRKGEDEDERKDSLSKKVKKEVEQVNDIENTEKPKKTQVEIDGKLSKFPISKKTKKGLKARGIKYLFPIQSKTFDLIYEGYDVIGKARTGTGKTLAFALPVIERLQKADTYSKRGRAPMVLVMVPTRELAKQVSDEFEAICSELSVYCIYGGTAYAPQETAIRSGLDVLIGTPGRILDHMQRRLLDLSKLKHCILDEVDRMLDMGFQESVEQILADSYKSENEEKPQTLFFSATLPEWVERTAKKYMSKNRKLVDVIGNEKQRTALTVEHKAIKCPYQERAATIGDVVQVYCGAHGRTIIFAPTKQEVNELALNDILKQDAQALHGDIPQKQREITLKGFRDGKFRCLVATDVAARGLDIPEVDLVVQCEPPKDADAYIHRAGRTGRAQRKGVCIIFYKYNQESLLKMVERKAGIKFKRIGAPQPEDIIKASAEDAKRFLGQVSSEALVYFREAAQDLIDERGAVDAVAAALAHISGTTEIKSRSMLTSQEGFTTYILKQDRIEMRSAAYMWRVIESSLAPEVKPEIKGMTLFEDHYGVVFDVPSFLDPVIEKSWSNPDGVILEKAKELPELVSRTDFNNGSNNRFGSFRTGNNRNFNSSNSFNRYDNNNYQRSNGGQYDSYNKSRSYRDSRNGNRY